MKKSIFMALCLIAGCGAAYAAEDIDAAMYDEAYEGLPGSGTEYLGQLPATGAGTQMGSGEELKKSENCDG